MRNLLTLLLILALPAAAIADGFHSPLLREKDPRKWATTLRENLGLDRSDSAADADRVPAHERKAAAGRLLDVLRYLDRKNVLLREFPDFNYDDIPAFRSETEALLIAIGREAAPLLVRTLVADITGGGADADAADMKRVENLDERLIVILVAIGPDALPAAMESLAHDDARVRAALLRVVRGIVKEPDFGSDVADWQGWYRIWRAGRDRDAAAVPDLVKALAGPDARLRLAAAQALGEIGSRAAVPGLLALLGDAGDTATIRVAVRALAKIGDETAAPEMIRLLASPRPGLREEAATALRFLTKTSYRNAAGESSTTDSVRAAIAVAKTRPPIALHRPAGGNDPRISPDRSWCGPSASRTAALKVRDSSPDSRPAARAPKYQ